MAKKDCPEGFSWDRVVKTCIKDRTESRAVTKPPTESFKQLRATTMTTTTKMTLPPALWISVGLVTLGSMLALAIWFMICRRQRRHSSSSSVAANPEEDPLQKTAKVHLPCSDRNVQAEMYQRAAEVPPSCHHLHPGALMGSQREDIFTVCSGPSELTGTEVGVGLPACISVTEHRIPLPATELGGTALVTTKTV